MFYLYLFSKTSLKNERVIICSWSCKKFQVCHDLEITLIQKFLETDVLMDM